MPIFAASIDAVALAAATAKTVAELGTAATTPIKILDWWVEFDGVSSAAVPVKVEVGRFSAAVTTATTVTLSKVDYGGNAVAANTVFKHSTSTEGAGTASDVEIHRISPTSGVRFQYPLGREWVVGASGFWRIRITAAATVNATFGFLIEE